MIEARFLITALVAAAALMAAQPCRSSEASRAGVGPDPAPAHMTNEEAHEASKNSHFTTGLHFSMWYDHEKNVVGPGLDLGLVLIPQLLELEFQLGSMVGKRVNTIPIGMAFRVPFELGMWFVTYVEAGPTLFIEREQRRTWHDWAATASAGIAVNIPGFLWRVYLEGNYNFRFWQGTDHQGGGTIGFRYRF